MINFQCFFRLMRALISHLLSKTTAIGIFKNLKQFCLMNISYKSLNYNTLQENSSPSIQFLWLSLEFPLVNPVCFLSVSTFFCPLPLPLPLRYAGTPDILKRFKSKLTLRTYDLFGQNVQIGPGLYTEKILKWSLQNFDFFEFF